MCPMYLGADNNGVKQAADAQAGQQRAQPRVKIAHDCQLQACMQVILCYRVLHLLQATHVAWHGIVKVMIA